MEGVGLEGDWGRFRRLPTPPTSWVRGSNMSSDLEVQMDLRHVDRSGSSASQAIKKRS